MASVFSSIIAGDIPGRFVWTDDDVVGFLTIAPVTQGHVLVVPRNEIDVWQDVEPEVFGQVTRVAQTIARAVDKVWSPERVTLMVAGTEVPHLHLHVWPAYELADFALTKSNPNPTPESLDEAQTKIKDALRELGYGANVPD
jgi:diadenosine tetraphosphate (Ap4A) HIT family hydrolase